MNVNILINSCKVYTMMINTFVFAVCLQLHSMSIYDSFSIIIRINLSHYVSSVMRKNLYSTCFLPGLTQTGLYNQLECIETGKF